jgi:hypothetical protein
LKRLISDVDVYGHSRAADKDFLPSIQKILATLGEVTNEIPMEHALDFSQTLYVSRVSATLHLMLYQVNILLPSWRARHNLIANRLPCC